LLSYLRRGEFAQLLIAAAGRCLHESLAKR
jgi:hypothetical protein